MRDRAALLRWGAKRCDAVHLVGALLLAAGLLQAWTHRYHIHPDGLSYIDIADAYARGDFRTAINPLWSPLTAWLYVPFLALGLPRDLEPAVFHLLNVPILLFAYLVFAQLVRTLIPNRGAQAAAPLVFAWTQIQLMPLSIIGGDRLSAALLFLAILFMLRGHHFRAGTAFGFAFLAKAIMLPLAVVTLPLLLWRRRVRGFARALGGLLLITAPWIAVLSVHQGKFTYSEAGRLNYLFDINGMSRRPHVPEATADSLIHPVRILVDVPRIYEFREPFNVTYPYHYDLSYWYEGARPRYDARATFSLVGHNIVALLGKTDFLLIALAALLIVGHRRRAPSDIWFAAWPAVAGTAAYLLRHIEPRYVAPMIALLALAVLAHIELPSRTRTYIAGVAAAALLFAGPIGRLGLDALSLFGYDRRWAPHNANPETVRALRAAGVRTGDELATIGDDFFYAHNARSVGARVVAEAGSAGKQQFWTVAEAQRDSAFARMKSVGIDAVIADRAAPGWRPLGSSGQYIYLLD